VISLYSLYSALLVLLEMSAVIFSTVALSSCDFFEFTQKVGNVPLSQLLPEETSDFATNNPTLGNVTQAGFGMLQWSPNFWGCTDYANRASLGTAFRTGQAGALLATSFGLLAVLLNVTELLCCRFVCAKVLACVALIVALIGQALTFVLYASDICLHRDNAVYACQFGSGCAWSIVAFLCFLLASLLVCPAPKPNPLCKQVCDKRHSRGPQQQQPNAPVSDPCCYCFRKKKKDDDDLDKDAAAKKEEDEKKKSNGDVEEGKEDDDGSVYNDTVTDVPMANGGVDRSTQAQPPGYPQEVYTRSSRNAAGPPPPNGYAMDSSTQTPMYQDDGDDGDDNRYFSSAVSVPAAVSYYHPSSSAAPPTQYHYYAPPMAAPQLSSFVNAEVMDGDLFFDSKTV
jgi:hypothetical protein